LRASAAIDRLALVGAGWMRFLRERPQAVDDPLGGPLAELSRHADDAARDLRDPEAAERRRTEVFAGFKAVFGELGADARFVRAVAAKSLALERHGVLAAVSS
jgi:fructuronate reductase